MVFSLMNQCGCMTMLLSNLLQHVNSSYQSVNCTHEEIYVFLLSLDNDI